MAFRSLSSRFYNKLYKSDPFTIDLSKSGMSSLSAEVPDFEIEKLPVVPNSKKTYFKIKNFKKNDGTAFEGDSQYTYYIKYKKIGEEFSKSKIIDSFSEDLIVEVPNEICAYNFQLVVSNGSAEKCSSEIQKSILSADDSIPPVIHLDSSTGTKCSWMELSTNRLLVKNFFSDSGIGFAEEDYEDAFGVYKRIPVKYCYSFDSKNDSVNWNADYVKTTYSYTRVSSKGTKEPHVLSPYLEFPRDGEKGTYLHVLVQDANKNSTEYSVSTIPGYRELLLCKKAEGDLTVGDVYYNWNVSISFIAQYINSDEWEYTNQLLTYANQNHTVSINSSTQVNSNKARKLNLSYTNGEKKSFVRVMFNDAMDTIANIASKPLYYCPGYYEGTVSCKLKGTSNTEFGLAIFADSNSPCFAHTFYSSTNLGNSKEKLEDWLYYGIETGLKMNTGSFTYTDDNYDAVPSGMYYTTIVHFADGTMSMTDVKQKN